MQYKRKRDIENTVYSLCYDYFSSDTFNKIPELVSYMSLKGLQPLISKLLYERYANYHIQIRHLQFRLSHLALKLNKKSTTSISINVHR